MLLALIFLPLAAALTAWFIQADGPRRCLLVFTALAEFILAASCWVYPPASVGGELLYLDQAGLLVLSITCTLFLAASIYGTAYLKAEDSGKRKDFQQGLHFTNAPEATFTGCLLLFLAAAVLVACTRHFGLLWVGIETTTLVSAPLIYFHRHRRSLEATWKYLMICSVGIALALVGNLLLDISMQTGGHGPVDMSVGALQKAAGAVHPGWFKTAFVFLFIGYGTKMGVAPMHTWLPDAHSEAPSLVSALLSGALLNCAFLGIFRSYQVGLAAGLGDFASTLLTAFGLFSMFIAALFIVGQGDFKRLPAYSGVEHMGILLLGLGATYGLAPDKVDAGIGWSLHMINHSLVKGAIFLLAGNILAKYHTKSSHDVTGLLRVMPRTGILWLIAMLALTGAPPFAVFGSEVSVLQGLWLSGPVWLAPAYLVLLGVIFVGMITPTLRMCRGKAPYGIEPMPAESSFLWVPPAVLLALVLLLGLYLPEPLRRAAEALAHPGLLL